ncbi:hypothetical protein [Caldimonas tepidiphila]|uniref:hypothetical protein n=1 Tax=Caldimonas tepidiphila TaxID=2315841 RepID=UPI000E5B4D06|nr:hypothetical protein [Caldimonas tepidiphila]
MHALSYPSSFQRDMACTEAEFLGWLPGAVGTHAMRLDGAQACVRIGGGTLHLRWQVSPPRRIALITLPRLVVDFEFDGVDEPQRTAFMRYFDLFMQRGGG